MTTSTSRACTAASTASSWPGRKAANPKSSRSASAGTADRATGACGSGSRPGRVSAESAMALMRADDHIAASGGVRGAVAALSHPREREGALERVLGLGRRLGLRQRVLAGEAGIAVAAAVAVDGRVHALERQV